MLCAEFTYDQNIKFKPDFCEDLNRSISKARWQQFVRCVNFSFYIHNHPPTIDKYRSKEATSASATSF